MAAPVVKILTPAYMGQVTTQYMHSLIEFIPYAMSNGINVTFETMPNCSLISLGRNVMQSRALRDPTWTHLMWIDSDIRFPKEAIISMLFDDKPIMGGFYPKKSLPIDMASSPMPGGEETEQLFETDYVATGFMLIKREVIEKMQDSYPERKFFYQGSDEYYDLYAPYIDEDSPNRLFLTEDYAFCRLARKIGYKSYMSKRFTLGHIGVYEFNWNTEKNLSQAYIQKYAQPKQKLEKVEGDSEDYNKLDDLPQ
ncbi:hypothetical protein Syn7803US13_266 [Synechococcus phage ACG-2014f]|uniref:Uncharacterized protein n=3 Tax=Atlauavirus TaxID=2733092 RepID=A0A0E3FL96_9CAUD|nr:hypothetical protein AAJ63_gp276 [Synechococcus phage ACG-2014f]YP_009778424.1 hypothetical protein HOQ61_gp270 [Synechococcus phage ACG-2014f_Syn7803C7]AIX16793.1 hypothetical protein Syn7803C58_268 [Synechococcus phage ACG-2014f]AIX18571.1 hypothetical protein Syn7803C6_272 [Synechococcus phage ACG-2014f]AIX20161.1 hypothetical protein Syn7803C7_270 [Synechococcus phage ACG-2014f_Syn7803C7]AIX20449.1 hypothetical protein Syn7803C80_272 [Synechococcus phage ACG-2014f]AIX21887.1 hypothetic